jgi:hypothetical protein
MKMKIKISTVLGRGTNGEREGRRLRQRYMADGLHIPI